jgi:hypothetical protein
MAGLVLQMPGLFADLGILFAEMPGLFAGIRFLLSSFRILFAAVTILFADRLTFKSNHAKKRTPHNRALSPTYIDRYSSGRSSVCLK